MYVSVSMLSSGLDSQSVGWIGVGHFHWEAPRMGHEIGGYLQGKLLLLAYIRHSAQTLGSLCQAQIDILGTTLMSVIFGFQ